MGRVAVIGSYIVAMVIDAKRIPVAGETLAGRNYRRTHGGKGSNMACCSARLGSESAFVGKVGRDAFARDFLELLTAEGVDAAGVIYSDRLPTAIGIIISSADGSNIIVVDPGACGDLTPFDVRNRRDLIESASVVLSPLEIPLDAALAGAEIAASRGIPAILNPAPACDLRSSDLSSIYVLTPNEHEARVCLGIAPDAAADFEALGHALLSLGPRNVVITMGAEGAMWISRGGARHIPAMPVAAVDTVGAGDAFNAGLAVALGEGASMEDALVMGTTAASLSTRTRETIASYPMRAEVDKYIRKTIPMIAVS